MRNKHASSTHFKEINFISDGLQLIGNDKRKRVKSDKPILTGQTCLDVNKQLLRLNMNT